MLIATVGMGREEGAKRPVARVINKCSIFAVEEAGCVRFGGEHRPEIAQTAVMTVVRHGSTVQNTILEHSEDRTQHHLRPRSDTHDCGLGDRKTTLQDHRAVVNKALLQLNKTTRPTPKNCE